MLSIPAQPRFLICRLSAVGDTVHTLPVVNAIREHWPDAFIGWVVEPGPAPFVTTHTAVDHTIIAPKGFLKSPRALWQLRRELRAPRFNIVLDPQSLTKSAICGWLSGARTRIGFAPPVGRELAPWLHTHAHRAFHSHVVPRYIEILRPLGIEVPASKIEFRMPREITVEQRMRQCLFSAGITSDFALMNPGAGWDSKVWPWERYAETAAGLSIPSFVVWAGEKERTWAEQIVMHSQGQAILAPATSLLELAALARCARIFIGSDTGPLHIAAAVGTPCAAVYGPTNPAICGPFGKQHRVLQGTATVVGKIRNDSGDSMQQVSVAEMLLACKELLHAGSNPRQAA